MTVYSMLPDKHQDAVGATVRNLRRRLKRRGGNALADALDSVLARLERQNHVVQAEDGSWFKLNGWWPLHASLVAVELKLNQPARVCEQARNNRRFAVQSFAALPASAVDRMRESTVRMFEEAGVGLLAVTERACRQVVRPPAAKPQDRDEQTLMVERLWRDHRGNTSVSSSSATRPG